jgi:hypothetical protein
VTEMSPEARISAGLAASTAADQRREERRRLADAENVEPETEEQRLDRLVEKMRAEPAWYDAQPSSFKIALGLHVRNKLRAQALFGDKTGEQK